MKDKQHLWVLAGVAIAMTMGGTLAVSDFTAGSIISAAALNQRFAEVEGVVNALAADNITDGAITNAKIGTNAVTKAKVADAAIDTDELVDDAVTSAKILNDNVTTVKILDANVTKAKLALEITDGGIPLTYLEKPKQMVRLQYSGIAANNATGPLDDSYYAIDMLPSGATNCKIHKIFASCDGEEVGSQMDFQIEDHDGGSYNDLPDTGAFNVKCDSGYFYGSTDTFSATADSGFDDTTEFRVRLNTTDLAGYTAGADFTCDLSEE